MANSLCPAPRSSQSPGNRILGNDHALLPKNLSEMKKTLFPVGPRRKGGVIRCIAIGLLSFVALAWHSDGFSLVAQEPSSSPWFERCIVGMEVGPTGAQWGHSDPTDEAILPRMGRSGDRQEVRRGQRGVSRAVAARW
jgi:hypothetical protein